MVLAVDTGSAVAGNNEIAEPLRQSPLRVHQVFGSDLASSASIIFPPIEHENLLVHEDSHGTEAIIGEGERSWFSDTVSHSDSDSNSASSTFPASDSSADRLSLRSQKELIPVVRASRWTEILQAGMAALLRLVRTSFSSSRGIFVTYRSATITASVIAFLYLRRRQRWRAERRSFEKLTGIIDQREERINQLFDQMSRLNQALLALQRSGMR
ncbi:hypothetical protein M569_17170 [Genlisea aurea]|uniref:Uncharacterized protein n=1 Tax=Genlisea aurea TaxID=192259 RepID=S8DE42_9LAMI|nr:hypothetical protein M569_17170 [Genlisea aurea]